MKFFHGSVKENLPFVQHKYPIRNTRDLFHVMRTHKERCPFLLFLINKLLKSFFSILIEPDAGFIEYIKKYISQKRHTKFHSSLLAK